MLVAIVASLFCLISRAATIEEHLEIALSNPAKFNFIETQLIGAVATDSNAEALSVEYADAAFERLKLAKSNLYKYGSIVDRLTESARDWSWVVYRFNASEVERELERQLRENAEEVKLSERRARKVANRHQDPVLSECAFYFEVLQAERTRAERVGAFDDAVEYVLAMLETKDPSATEPRFGGKVGADRSEGSDLGELYQSRGGLFSIRFPEGWVVKDMVSQTGTKAVLNEGDGEVAQILINHMKQVPPSLSLDGLSDAELIESIRAMGRKPIVFNQIDFRRLSRWGAHVFWLLWHAEYDEGISTTSKTFLVEQNGDWYQIGLIIDDKVASEDPRFLLMEKSLETLVLAFD